MGAHSRRRGRLKRGAVRAAITIAVLAGMAAVGALSTAALYAALVLPGEPRYADRVTIQLPPPVVVR